MGPPGKDLNRFVITGQLDINGGVVIALPAAIGTDPLSPPLMVCYMTDVPAAGVWLAVAEGWSATSAYCGLVFGGGVWNAVLLQGPSGWYAAFVLAY